jgi:hypothetical protein
MLEKIAVEKKQNKHVSITSLNIITLNNKKSCLLFTV